MTSNQLGESRADVEMGDEEDEEPLEAEIPRFRMNPKNPTSREKQAKAEVLVDNIELNCWKKNEEEQRRL